MQPQSEWAAAAPDKGELLELFSPFLFPSFQLTLGFRV
ncbi:hypothetical protein ENH_00018400 [Eimeria necatrix]|uniref:Uncharacterized protein n=1 Tax=Eimeria necatrix TaxID=51315 RepID=U6MQM3_9EIME|nr:hypothetical protein ENH_00018400 [Eimeria necatrix]CDJ66311.1 hypothetical protein ENH_00018400 [Eimeria necatrix]